MPLKGLSHHYAKDLTGKKFGHLTVEKLLSSGKGKTVWWAKCALCGSGVSMVSSELSRKRGLVNRSCGCDRGKKIGDAIRRHGMSEHNSYAVWRSMKSRCHNPKHPAYKNYGGRGITISTRWLESFDLFWEDMGPSYRSGLDLDRMDNESGYCKSNCRWVTRTVNSRNKRSNHFFPNTSKPISEISSECGIGVSTILYRIAQGWPTEKLLIKPDVRNRECSTSKTVDRVIDS